VKRISLGLVAVLAVLATGAATSACNLAPVAATVNGATIPVSSLNTQLNSLNQSTAGQCLLSLKFPQSLSLAAAGSGGSGTYNTSFAATILGSSVYNLLATQYAVAHGVHVSAADLTAAQSTYESTLDGAISSQAQQDASIGGTPSCADANGVALTGKQVLAGLPPEMRNIEVTNQAVEELLLARGADLSDAAVLTYYAANPGQFTLDCVGAIVVADQATADTVFNKLQAGADFTTLATSTSTDAKSAAEGGQLGCNFPESQVLQSLQETALTVGKPVTPQQTQSGEWVVYQVSSRTVQPVTTVASEIREVLLQATANRQRVSNQVLAFAKASSVDVNPQYGSWTRAQVVPPTPPAPRYLAPQVASSGSGTTTTTSPLSTGSSTGTSGTAGTTGAAGTTGG
jgi:PPIC-type PPIASE domain